MAANARSNMLATGRMCGLLFLSGGCALTYQVAWFREFRLVFGASTAASAAVLAVFMGGLGLGNAWLGRRADAHSRPLRFYALLEAGVAIAALLTPHLIDLGRAVYVACGGQSSLGFAGATVVRLLLAAIVLAPPTLLMGGTLPAAARFATGNDDPQRRRVALLYGTNTLGAVCGALGSTFLGFDLLGTRDTLRLACAVNLAVAAAAWAWSRTAQAATDLTAATGPAPAPAGSSRAERRRGRLGLVANGPGSD